MKEIWKTMKDYESSHEVSNLGNIRSISRMTNSRHPSRTPRLWKGRLIKQRLSNNGYLEISLFTNAKNLRLKVARLVAKSFIPNPNNYPEVDHIDRDKTNNKISNLRWCTRSQNMHNTPKMKRNTSGFKGVSKSLAKNRWVARIMINGKRLHIGSFSSKEEADEAYKKKVAEIKTTL